MTKCPECGKELEQDEILVPIFNSKNKKEILGFFHVKSYVFKLMCTLMRKNNWTFEEFTRQGLKKLGIEFPEK